MKLYFLGEKLNQGYYSTIVPQFPKRINILHHQQKLPEDTPIYTVFHIPYHRFLRCFESAQDDNSSDHWVKEHLRYVPLKGIADKVEIIRNIKE